MGYSVEAKLIYAVPADEVPQQWLDAYECQDAGEVWLEYGKNEFSCYRQGWDGSTERFVGYILEDVDTSCYAEMCLVELAKEIERLDKTPFNEMAEYKPIRPRLFLICSYM